VSLSRTELRATARLWLVPVAVVLAVLALLVATGGLRAGHGATGRRAAAGEVLELARWRLVVHDVELARDPYDRKADPHLDVHLGVTLTGDRSTYALPSEVLSVTGPSGPLGVQDQPSVVSTRSGYDPDVPQEVTLSYLWPGAPATAPGVVRLLVRDESMQENFLTSADWEVRPTPVAHLDLPCADLR